MSCRGATGLFFRQILCFLSTVEYVVIQTRLGWPWQGQVQPSVECSGQLYTGQLWREEGTIMLGMDRQAG